MFAYCGNNPINKIDLTGEFGWLAAALVSATVNVVVTYVAAKVTGQDYTLKDAAVAAISGAANTIPVVGPYIAGAISGTHAAISAAKSGGTAGEVALCFFASSIATTLSIGNLAQVGTKTLSTVVANASADLVFGTGFNCLASSANKAVSIWSEARKERTQNTTVVERNARNYKSNRRNYVSVPLLEES